MKATIITGACGFIGTNCTIEAINRGYTVYGFDNLHRDLTEENLKYLQETYKDKFVFIHGDVRNPSDFIKFPKEASGIIHLAGQCGIPYSLISPMYDFEVNTVGVLNMLEYSRTHGNIPFAFASSNKAYTNITNTYPMRETETRYEWTDRTSLDENVPIDAFGRYARSPYGTSKVASDLYCQEYYQCFGTPTVVNRMSCIYGLFQKGVEDQAWVDWFIRQIAFGDGKINIFGNGKQVRDMLWGGDVARLYNDEIEQIDKVKGNVYNIGGGPSNTMSLEETIQEIIDQSGKGCLQIFHPKRHGDQDIWIQNIDKIKNDLGWEPTVSPKEGIRRIIEQYKTV